MLIRKTDELICSKSRNYMLPNFLIIGSQKSGTTWIAKNLAIHSDIFVHFSPEINFFNLNFEKGLDWYKSFFNSEKHVVGEKSPAYLACRDVPKRIKDTLPDVKLIISLRNPVDRAISAVNFYRMIGRLQIIRADRFINDLVDGKNKEFENQYKTISTGKYIDTLPPYFDLFPSENILLLIYEEDIKQEPVAGMTKICQFLDVKYVFDKDKLQTRINKTSLSAVDIYLNKYSFLPNRINRMIKRLLPQIPFKDEIKETTLKRLYEYYQPANAQLFEYLGRRIESWELC